MKINKKLAAMIMAGTMFATSTVNVFAATNKRDINHNNRTYEYYGKEGDAVQYKDSRGNNLYITSDPKDTRITKFDNWYPKSYFADQITQFDKNEYDPYKIKTTNHIMENSIINGVYDSTSDYNVDSKVKKYIEKEILTPEEVIDYINVAQESVSRATGYSLKGGTIVDSTYYNAHINKVSNDIKLVHEELAIKMETSKQARLDLIKSFAEQTATNFYDQDIIFDGTYTSKQVIKIMADKMNQPNPIDLLPKYAGLVVVDYYDTERDYTKEIKSVVEKYDESMTNIGNYTNKKYPNSIISKNSYEKQKKFASNYIYNIQGSTHLTFDYNTYYAYLLQEKNSVNDKNYSINWLKNGIYGNTLMDLYNNVHALGNGGNQEEKLFNWSNTDKRLSLH